MFEMTNLYFFPYTPSSADFFFKLITFKAKLYILEDRSYIVTKVVNMDNTTLKKYQFDGA